MKKILLILPILLIAGAGFANVFPEASVLNVKLAKYDPYPAEAEKYVNLWFKFENTGIEPVENLTTKLIPEFPFYVDDTEKLEKNYGLVRSKSDILVEYRIRVSDDAPDGTNSIKIKYRKGEDAWFEKNFSIVVDKQPTNAELTPLFVDVEPFAYPTGSSELTVDIANIAPGTAYYTVVKARSPVANIKRNKIFIGTLDADDFDSVDFDLDFKNVSSGAYPVNIEMIYKNEDWNEIKTNGTVYVDLISLKEARQRNIKPIDPLILIGLLIAGILALKFIVWPIIRKVYNIAKSKLK